MMKEFLNVADCEALPNVRSLRLQFEEFYIEEMRDPIRAAQFTKALHKAGSLMERSSETGLAN